MAALRKRKELSYIGYIGGWPGSGAWWEGSVKASELRLRERGERTADGDGRPRGRGRAWPR
jgi:hypothetical protein